MQYLHKEDIQCIIPPKSSRGAIYIGNIESARNINTLKKFNIKAVITLALGGFLKHSSDDLPNYLYIPAKDAKSFDLSIYFNKTFDFIQRHRKNTNILVHCVAGVSRSVTIVIAYIMKKQRKKMIDAFQMVRKIRSVIQPNEGFICQLMKYEEQIMKRPESIQNKAANNQKSELQEQKNSMIVRSKSIIKQSEYFSFENETKSTILNKSNMLDQSNIIKQINQINKIQNYPQFNKNKGLNQASNSSNLNRKISDARKSKPVFFGELSKSRRQLIRKKYNAIHGSIPAGI